MNKQKNSNKQEKGKSGLIKKPYYWKDTLGPLTKKSNMNNSECKTNVPSILIRNNKVFDIPQLTNLTGSSPALLLLKYNVNIRQNNNFQNSLGSFGNPRKNRSIKPSTKNLSSINMFQIKGYETERPKLTSIRSSIKKESIQEDTKKIMANHMLNHNSGHNIAQKLKGDNGLNLDDVSTPTDSIKKFKVNESTINYTERKINREKIHIKPMLKSCSARVLCKYLYIDR